MSRERRAARQLVRALERMSARDATEGELPFEASTPAAVAPEVAVARRLQAWSDRLPPAPDALRQRVAAMVSAATATARACPPGRRAWRSAALGALAATVVLVAIWALLPSGQQVVAQALRVLLGQTQVQVTAAAVRETPPPTRAVRTPLRDLLAVELTMGRAPSLPRALPEGYQLREMCAVSYPELPNWISQPLYVELSYGPQEGAPGLWLREYRLLFREYGGIKGIAASGEAVAGLEEVDVAGAPGALLTFSGIEPTQTLIWERDGMLLELETDCLTREDLVAVARSVR
ncbi:MAG: anti-sigma factor [Anaerolineae bacterium]|nr:anti-sigma factor [Anaerolineae bacterium]